MKFLYSPRRYVLLGSSDQNLERTIAICGRARRHIGAIIHPEWKLPLDLTRFPRDDQARPAARLARASDMLAGHRVCILNCDAMKVEGPRLSLFNFCGNAIR